MIEQAAYELNPLMQKIRSERGTNTRSNKGVPVASELLQDGIRPNTSRSDSISDSSSIVSGGSEGIERGIEGIEGTTERRDSRKRRASATADQSDGGSNSHLNPISRAFQFKSTDNGGLNEEKPSGLYTKPNSKERAARETDQSSHSPSGPAQSKKNFFSWLRSNNNRKTSKGPRVKRTRPLTEKEVEELKPNLVEALEDALPLLDQFILATNKAHNKPYIYSSLDNEDIDKLANWWLKKACKSSEMAAAANQLIAYHDDVEILVMTLPMFGDTFKFYKDNGGFTLRGR